MERQHKLQTAVCLNRIESRADVVVTDDHTVQIGTEHYSVGFAFGSEASQRVVASSLVPPAVITAFDGYDVSVLVCGAQADNLLIGHEAPGLIYYLLDQVYERLAHAGASSPVWQGVCHDLLGRHTCARGEDAEAHVAPDSAAAATMVAQILDEGRQHGFPHALSGAFVVQLALADHLLGRGAIIRFCLVPWRPLVRMLAATAADTPDGRGAPHDALEALMTKLMDQTAATLVATVQPDQEQHGTNLDLIRTLSAAATSRSCAVARRQVRGLADLVPNLRQTSTSHNLEKEAAADARAEPELSAIPREEGVATEGSETPTLSGSSQATRDFARLFDVTPREQALAQQQRAASVRPADRDFWPVSTARQSVFPTPLGAQHQAPPSKVSSDMADLPTPSSTSLRSAAATVHATRQRVQEVLASRHLRTQPSVPARYRVGERSDSGVEITRTTTRIGVPPKASANDALKTDLSAPHAPARPAMYSRSATGGTDSHGLREDLRSLRQRLERRQREEDLNTRDADSEAQIKSDLRHLRRSAETAHDRCDVGTHPEAVHPGTSVGAQATDYSDLLGLNQELVRTNQRLQAAHHTLDDRVMALQSELRASKDAAQRAQAERNHQANTIERLQAENGDLRAALQHEGSARVKELVGQLSDLNSRLEQATAQAEDRGIELERTRSALHELQKDNSTFMQKNDRLQKDVSRLEAEVEDLKLTLQQVEGAHHTKAQNVRGLRTERLSLGQQAEQLQRQVDTLTNELGLAAASHDQLRTHAEESREEAKALRRHNKQLEKGIKEVEDNVERLEAELAAALSAKTDVEGQLSTAQQQLEEYQANVTTLQKQNQAQRNKVAAATRHEQAFLKVLAKLQAVVHHAASHASRCAARNAFAVKAKRLQDDIQIVFEECVDHLAEGGLNFKTRRDVVAGMKDMLARREG
ncbi:uncharacterized protein MONBRDRAFT_5573 [Monosiga brevicollis MX1]|uniref:Uncharacterized protein n=1 Tax=Monosiga brevicollis TaxID=81824 RepID=A9URU7_MONBE|nr:uncharacterized protein MONBRDRAFT_5573 [Monosiga brevicollis MX1]EDQ91668.1 predicted protein [Monosiga brevicollis MX1]|eukprot:XP_001742954.1 hypothetical protein [Monosiga brevicollis MX1]